MSTIFPNHAPTTGAVSAVGAVSEVGTVSELGTVSAGTREGDGVTQAVVGSWAAPVWAGQSRLDDGEVRHLAYGRPVEVSQDGMPVVLRPQAVQRDVIEVTEGRVVVAREGSPVIWLDDIELTPAQALDLADALAALVQRVGR